MTAVPHGDAWSEHFPQETWRIALPYNLLEGDSPIWAARLITVYMFKRSSGKSAYLKSMVREICMMIRSVVVKT